MAILARDNGDEDDNDNVDNVEIFDSETMAMEITIAMLARDNVDEEDNDNVDERSLTVRLKP